MKKYFFVHKSEISIFQEKGRCLRSLLKILFFAYISENINISGKNKLFRDHLRKIVFFPYIRKYQNSKKTFREKWTYFEITLKKSFLPIFSKIWTYLRKRRFLRSFWKKIIFCRYLCKYQHFVVKHVFYMFFVHKSVNIYISRKKQVFILFLLLLLSLLVTSVTRWNLIINSTSTYNL